MPKIFCPRCGKKAFNDDFTGTSKPCCLSCGWNLELAKERSRSQLQGWPIALAVFGALFVCIAYFSKDPFALAPFILVAGLLGFVAISGWRHLRKLNAARITAPHVDFSLLRTPGAPLETKKTLAVNTDLLLSLSKPRRVRLKVKPKIISIVFPISVAIALYFGFNYVREGLLPHTSVSDLWLPLIIAVIWSTIAIQTLRHARRDWKLLAEGDWAVGTVTAQWMTSGRHPHSKISFQFRDLLGRSIFSEADDDSRALFEEMQIVVFYDQTNPERCVPQGLAACEFVQY